MNRTSLLEHISVVRDPRQSWKIEYKITGIVFLMVAAVIAETESLGDIEGFGQDNLNWLQEYGDFTDGVPVHDTIARAINLISAKQLQRCFAKWMQNCHEVTKGEVITIDGKTL